MSLRHSLCIPAQTQSHQETKLIEQLLQKVQSNLDIPYDIIVFRDDENHKKELIAISVKYGLRLPQTSRTKKLRYPHIILRERDQPLMFYPQMRRGEHGTLEISIRTYLESLLQGHVKSLVDIPELRQFELLREGYLELAKETRLLNKELEAADAEWPD